MNINQLRGLDRIPSQLKSRALAGEYSQRIPYPIACIYDELEQLSLVGKSTKIATMGSCFAQQVQSWLDAHKFSCLHGNWGAIYTSQNILQTIKSSLYPNLWDPKERFWVIGGKYYDPYLRGVNYTGPQLLGENANEAEITLHKNHTVAGNLLKNSEIVVWTLGLTELWRNRHDHLAYFALPYPQVFDESNHEFYNLQLDDVLEQLNQSLELLRAQNPLVKIIISVSPIPLRFTFRSNMGPFMATQQAKSTLIVAALKMAVNHRNVFYLPSYEIIKNNCSKNYESDGRHVSAEGIKAVMSLFKKMFVQC